nr:hypothetical protein [Tanacetum cinerariifolium]
SDDGITTSFQQSRNSRPPMLDHQDKYMMKAQVHVLKSSAISNEQALPRRKHYCQIYQMINFTSVQTPGSGISILLAVGTPFTGSGNLYCQWELSPGSGNALCILFPTPTG